MCTRSKQTNIITIIILFIIFQLICFILFASFNQTKDEYDKDKSTDCKKHEFRCQSDDPSLQICIHREQICDRTADCPKGDDEEQCHDYNLLNYVYLYQINRTLSFDQPDPSKINPEPRKNFNSCFQKADCDFDHPNMTCCDHKNLGSITKLPKPTIQMLKLINNGLTHLDKRLFQNLSRLMLLSLAENKLTEIDEDTFYPAYNLKRIFLSRNRLTVLPDKLFANQTRLELIDVKENRLIHVNLKMFAHLTNLFSLDLSSNQLTLEGQIFPPNLKRLELLILHSNNIERITDETFKNLFNLSDLDLKHNKIFEISPFSFHHNINLKHLQLNYNQLSDSQITPQLIRPLSSLTSLDLSYNPFNYLPEDMFYDLTKLTSINLEGLTIYNITENHFDELVSLNYIYFPHFRYCLYVPRVTVCKPFTDKVSSLRSLLALTPLKVIVWSVSISIIMLNFMVLFVRSIKNPKHLVLTTYVKLLSVSDSLIGFYLLAIGFFDLGFGKDYHTSASKFVHSWQCTGLGVMAVFSKQFSLFIVLLISFDRNRLITLGNFHIRTIYHFLLVTICFFLSIFIALFPVIYWSEININNIYFAANLLCYPLHLTEPFLLGWQFNAFVNIFINLPIVSTIILLYAHMYLVIKENRKETRPAINLNVSKTNISNTQEHPLNDTTDLFISSDKSNHYLKSIPLNDNLIVKNGTSNTDEDRALALRLFFIVATDCICWLPIIFSKIVALFQIEIPALLISWLIIVILPFNCLLNSIIYTIAVPKRLSKLFRDGYSFVKNKIRNLFKIKSTQMKIRKSSADLNVSSGLDQIAINSSQITLQFTERKSSKEQEKYDFDSCLDCNNNENFIPVNRSLIKSSTTTV